METKSKIQELTAKDTNKKNEETILRQDDVLSNPDIKFL